MIPKKTRKKPQRDEQARMPGEIRYRPPTGKASDRALNRLLDKNAGERRRHNGGPLP